MQALILAAGMGQRMGKYTENHTKCMVSVAGKTILERLIDSIKYAGIEKLVMVIGYEAEKLREYIEERDFGLSIEYVYNYDYKTTNNIYSLYLAREYLKRDDTILLESDLLFDREIVRKVVSQKQPNMVVVAKYEHWMDGTVVVLDEKKNIMDFISKTDFRYDEAHSYYKTVNIHKFSKEFSDRQYIPFLEAYIKAYGVNQYYEQVLKIFAHIHHSELSAYVLQNEKWIELDVEEKLDVMQTIANIEASYLGLPNELNVSVANLQENRLGSYSDGIRTIYIDLSHLESASAREVLNTCAHEAYHSYQHRLIDAYNSTDENVKNLMLYKKAVTYQAEFENYVDGTQDFDLYYGQSCEADARKYAKSAVEDYYNKIYDYLGIKVLDLDTDSETESYSISYDENRNVYLLDKNNTRIAGPYKVIEDDFQYNNNEITRYIGENGLYGYLSLEGKEITEAVFQEASIFQDGIAMVSINGEMIYYIDTLGERITKDYLDGYPYENQGSYARVKLEDGTWGIINRQDKIVFEGADYIEELPMVTTLGCAIVNGQAVLFSLELGGTEEVSVIRTYEDFCDISVYLGEFGIVTNKHGLQGVIKWNGDILVPAEYREIRYELVQDNVLFKLQKNDGSYETMYLYGKES